MPGTIRAVLVAGVVVVFAGSLFGLWSFKVIGYDTVSGQATFDIRGVIGPDKGPPCPADRRYMDEQPTGLRDDVVAEFEKIKAEAREQNVTLCLNDGKRSSRQQQAQFEDYVRRYGSVEEASKHVLPAGRSMHELGTAIDVQPLSAASWLERTAGSYGWCRRYENEPWHFEYDPNYRNGCPTMLPHA